MKGQGGLRSSTPNYSISAAGPRGERGLPGTNQADSASKKRASLSEIRALLPDVYKLIFPRRWVLLGGLGIVLINRLAGLVLPASTTFLIDTVLGAGHHEYLLPLVGVVFAATLVQGASGYALTQIVSKAAQKLIAELRVQIQQHVIRLPLGYFDRQKSGVLVSRIMNDVEGLRNLIGTGLIDLLGGLVTATVAIGVLVFISPRMTVIALLFMAVLSWRLGRVFARVRPVFRERSKIYGEVTGRLTESIGGVRVVKSYRAEQYEATVFAQGVERLLDNVLRSLSLIASMGLQTSVMLGVVGGITMYLGSHEIIAGHLTLGGFVTFTLFLGFLVAPIAQMVNVGTQISEAFAGLERMNELLNEVQEGREELRTVELPRIEGQVQFDDIWFEYQPGQPVLKSISFVAAPGSITALVGRSGAGKTTIISLIGSFYLPTSGMIRIDGQDLTTLNLDTYRSQLGIVLQETFLFDGTVRENIAFSKPQASEDELREACRIAHVDEFTSRLPDGYDTIVGERGVKLSGGQRQRVAIARALLVDPRILILDEATSNLDTESEKLIQEGLSYLMHGRTVFVIAHRLSTVRRAQQILVVQDGRIVEQGDHSQLIERDGVYSQMVSMQSNALSDRLVTE